MDLPEATTLQSCIGDWNDLEKEFMQLEGDHDKYKKKLEEMLLYQKKCLNGIAHQRYRLKKIQESIARADISSPEDKANLKDLNLKMKNTKLSFRDMEDVLPHKNGLYLSIILGSVNISLLNKGDKYSYKEDYEKFKVTVSYITFMLSIALFFISSFRWLDAILHFLLVWYYCTLTIRENILVVNGSRIKGWWVTHHFISTVCAGITLIWPNGEMYQAFRSQHIVFSLYISFMYVLQYFYQKGSLYRLRCLGQGHDMDVTVEGFMSWMWKGLAFLLPLLFVGYFFQLYNSYVLYQLAIHPKNEDWQVYALSAIHLVLAAGNIITTMKVVKQKLSEQVTNITTRVTQKYRFNSQTKNV